MQYTLDLVDFCQLKKSYSKVFGRTKLHKKGYLLFFYLRKYLRFLG